jgi:hypothetical protein
MGWDQTSVPKNMAGAFAVDLGELEPKVLRTAVYPQGSFAQRAGPLTSRIPERIIKPLNWFLLGA